MKEERERAFLAQKKGKIFHLFSLFFIAAVSVGKFSTKESRIRMLPHTYYMLSETPFKKIRCFLQMILRVQHTESSALRNAQCTLGKMRKTFVPGQKAQTRRGRGRGRRRAQCCKIAKFDPFPSLDCSKVEGVGGAIQGR